MVNLIVLEESMNYFMNTFFTNVLANLIYIKNEAAKANLMCKSGSL